MASADSVLVNPESSDQFIVFEDANVVLTATPVNPELVEIAAQGPPGSQGPMGGLFKQYVFAASMEWRVIHNMGIGVFVETLSDSAGNRFYAKLTIVNGNEFFITLTEMTAGSINVFFKP